jgi:NAD-dependent deacetylase
MDTCLCGGKLISFVVDFGQPLPPKDLEDAYRYSQCCDLFIVVGSSLVIYPAADMPRVAVEAGAKLVIINDGETPYDHLVHLRFKERVGEVLPTAVDQLDRLIRG